MGFAPSGARSPWTERALRWASPVLVLAAGSAMIAWTWRTWPDILVDFGKEIYIAWQISEGKSLYADIAYFNGPLSPYVNALWFRLFGASFLTLALCNIAIAGLIVAALDRLFTAVAGRHAAIAACLAFVLLFAFGNYTTIGNYNDVCPITHEMTHGMALSLAALLLLARFQRTGSAVWIAGAGAALGLVFLTRAEFFVAAAGATILGLTLTFFAGSAGAWPDTPSPHRPSPAVFPAAIASPPRARRSGITAGLGVFGASALAPPAAAFLLLLTRLPARQALLGTLGNWPSVLRGDVAKLPFYRAGLGIDDPAGNVAKMLLWSLVYGAIFGAAALLALRIRRPPGDERDPGTRPAGPAPRVRSPLASKHPFALRWRGALLPAAVFAIALAPLLIFREAIPWDQVARPLPLVLVALAAATVAGWLRERRARGARPALASTDTAAANVRILRLSLIAFGLGMLFKIALNTRIHHYGFAHGMPAALLAVAAVVEWIPAWIGRRGGSGGVFRAAALACLVAMTGSYLVANAVVLARKTHRVGSGADAILADARGIAVSQVLDELTRRARPSDTLAVLPEGAMLNYLSRRNNPTRYPILMPTEMTMFGEPAILESFRSAPPDFIALAHRDTSEFGVTFFGRDYARAIEAWIDASYEPVFLAGDPPFRDGRFGILLMQRRAAPL